MNPNSAHQQWSLWEYRVYPTPTHRAQLPTVKSNCARFGRLLFGSVSQMRILHRTDGRGRLCWEIAIRTEAHPVHDPRYTEWMHAQWRRFFQHGFGRRCEVQAHARLEAGAREDGAPPDQLIILPTLSPLSPLSPGDSAWPTPSIRSTSRRSSTRSTTWTPTPSRLR